jgi:hypothetical protein
MPAVLFRTSTKRPNLLKQLFATFFSVPRKGGLKSDIMCVAFAGTGPTEAGDVITRKKEN